MYKDDQKRGKPTQISRRHFNRLLATGFGAIAAVANGCALLFRRTQDWQPLSPVSCASEVEQADKYEYIVVGSGAGGGPLAANLAKSGHRVLLLEAGGDDEPINYQVPVFHPYASEDPSMSWNFFVRHYADDERQRRDTKFFAPENGILYPRAGTLGGCTAHNAMIIVYPHNSDWDAISDQFGDPSWRSENMRRYFERVERCTYVEQPYFGNDESRHGFAGWLTTTMADPRLVLQDRALFRIISATAKQSLRTLGGLFTRVLGHVRSGFDPNDWRRVQETGKRVEGVVLVPLAVNGVRRTGTREYIRHVERSCPQNLVVKTGALATRVILDEENRAVGVEYLEGKHLYRADPNADSLPDADTKRSATVSREVILCGGAFNSPQILKLSGIGPTEELRRLGIPVRVPLSGVGENLQDRYEICVVSEMKEDFALLHEGAFRPPKPEDQPDPLLDEWKRGSGAYATNGAVLGVIRRSASTPLDRAPNLFILGLVGYFKGYYPRYSEQVSQQKNYFTWVILKAHTENHAGRVLLRSSDPRDTPLINFHYFDEGSDKAGEDLESVVEGVEHVRALNASMKDYITREVVPGPEVQTREQLREFIKNEAWGHHASCSNKMGTADDPMAVVDNQFLVYGTKNLRVVDASVFPRIPGFFIVTSVYMIAEKASEVILTDAKRVSA